VESAADVEDIVGGWRARGEIMTVMNRKEEAVEAYARASEIAERTLGRHHRATLEVLIANADSYAYFAYTPQYLVTAQEAFERVTAAREHLRPDTLLTQGERVYSLALVSAGRGKDALPLIRRVVEDTRRLDAGDTQRVADAEWGLAIVLANLGILNEALPLMLHVIEHETRLGAAPNPQTLERAAWVGMMYAQAAMPVEADDAARRTDEIAAQVEAVSMPIKLRNQLTRAYAAAYQGDRARVRELTQAVRAFPECPETARLESMAIDTLDAHWHRQQARAGELALQLAATVEASKLPGYRRAMYLSIAASALLATNDTRDAQRVLQLADEVYRKAGLTASIHMSDFINTRARLGLLNGDTTVRDDLQTLVAAWQQVNPKGVRYGEALYWLSRVQAASDQAHAAVQTRKQAEQILKGSNLPAMRLLVAH
jgi:tetratricopeptide (TPR) repeat protein